MTTSNQAGVILTCTSDVCGCRIRIEDPCPHGDVYTCACGHPFEVATGTLRPDLPG